MVVGRPRGLAHRSSAAEPQAASEADGLKEIRRPARPGTRFLWHGQRDAPAPHDGQGHTGRQSKSADLLNSAGCKRGMQNLANIVTRTELIPFLDRCIAASHRNCIWETLPDSLRPLHSRWLPRLLQQLCEHSRLHPSKPLRAAPSRGLLLYQSSSRPRQLLADYRRSHP